MSNNSSSSSTTTAAADRQVPAKAHSHSPTRRRPTAPGLRLRQTSPAAFSPELGRFKKGRRVLIRGVQVTHDIGQGGRTFRAYTGAAPSSRSRNALLVRALDTLDTLALSAKVVDRLLNHAMSGPRLREVRVYERTPGMVQIEVTYADPSGGRPHLGGNRPGHRAELIPAADSDAIISKLHHFALAEHVIANHQAALSPTEWRLLMDTGIVPEPVRTRLKL